MNRIVCAAGLAIGFSVMGASQAQPAKKVVSKNPSAPPNAAPQRGTTPAAPAAASPPPRKITTAPAYTRATPDGTVGPITETPEQTVFLRCAPGFAPTIKNGKGYCWLETKKVHTQPTRCQDGYSSISDDKLPALPNVDWKFEDQCLSANGPPARRDSFSPSFCENMGAKKFNRVVNPRAADQCQVDLHIVQVGSPGRGDSILSDPRQADIDARSLICPTGWSLLAQDIYIVCKRD